MARLCVNISHISESEPLSSDSDFDMLSSPININARSGGQRIIEEDDDMANIITLSVDDVLGDGEKSGHCLVRMECLSASTGSNYSPYYDEEPRHQSPRDMQVPRDTPDWALLKKSIDYPESVGWDSNSETQCSRSGIHASSSGVAYVKIALSAEIKSSTDEVHQIVYHSPTLPTEADLDSCDAPALDSVMLRRAETLQEVSMVEYLNSEDLRRDPWNPAAPLLAVVNTNEPDDDAAILILERLQPYDAVPCKTVRDVVDLARQLLQGLIFLHDQGISHQGINPDAIVVETGDAPTDEPWERSEYDVRYYLVDFSQAAWIADSQQISLDLHHTAQSIKTIAGQTLIELSPLLRNMGNRESIQMTATQALQELESITQSIPASRMSAPLN